MVTSWNGSNPIENLRNHPEETVMTLQSLLAGGARIVPDPKRSGCYEVESDSLVYYIYVSPATGKITLLATWPPERVFSGADRAA